MFRVLLHLALCLGVGVAIAQTELTPESLEEHFKLYLVHPEKRSAQDKTALTGDAKTGHAALFTYWRSLQSREPDEEICNAYRWLLTGRGVYGKGAAEAFRLYPTLAKIQLRFVEIETGTKVGQARAEILPTQRVIPYLRVGVERASLLGKGADWGKVRDEMQKGKCLEVGGRYLDEKWLDREFIARGR